MAPRLSEWIRSNVTGLVAIFIALSGTAYAVDGPLAGVNQVGSEDIINGEVKENDLGANAVKTGKVADESLTAADLALGAVGSAEVANESLTGDDIQNASLNGGEISPATLGIREIIGNSLTHQVIADDAIRTNELAAGAVTPADLGPNVIPADGTGANGSTKLATDSVDFDEVASGAIHGVQVQDNALTGFDVNESSLGTVPDALVGGPVAMARISAGGSVSSARNLGQTNVSHPSEGNYCFDVPFTALGGSVTPNSYGFEQSMFALFRGAVGDAGCPAGTDWMVAHVFDGDNSDGPFWIQWWK